MVYQRIYTAENMKFLYLSPYVNAVQKEKEVFFTTSDNKKIVKLSLKDNPEYFLKKLTNGVFPNDLIQFFMAQLNITQSEAVSILQFLLVNKVLE